jgi:hypothetical protein
LGMAKKAAGKDWVCDCGKRTHDHDEAEGT